MQFSFIINLLSSLILVFCLGLFLFILFYKRKELFLELKKVPLFLYITALAVLTWGLLVPKEFSGRGDFGVWLMGTSNLRSWAELFLNARAPVYFWQTKFLTEFFDGISYEFLANINFIYFIISVFLVYLLIYNLLKSKKIALICSSFYLFSPVALINSLTEDYSVLGISFVIAAFFFASFLINKKDEFYFIAATVSLILAAGARVEYILFFPLFLLFYLLFLREGYWKAHLNRWAIFLVLAVPRTISAVGMYIADATNDPALHGRIYQYEGNLISYFFRVLKGASGNFLYNIQTGFERFMNIYDLTILLLLLSGLALVFLLHKNQKRKVVVFFLTSFLFIFFYYSFFHVAAGIRAYRYVAVALFPLSMLAGIGCAHFLKVKKAYFVLIGALIVFVGYFFMLPVTFGNDPDLIYDYNLQYKIFVEPEQAKEEYNKYKDLSYENRISRLFNDKFDVFTEEKTIFLSNGDRSILHAMPVNGHFISIKNINYLDDLCNLLSSGDLIYVSQSEMGFLFSEVDNFQAIPPQQFEEKVLDLFELEKILISYEKENYHFFLYRMRVI